MNHKKILFVNFSLDERTKELSKYSAEKNGFVNYLEMSSKDTFYLKMKKFFQICDGLNQYDFFIRSDADRIIMPGINNLINIFINDKDKPWFFQGTGIEYIMNMQERNATPNIYSKECVKYINQNFEKVVPNDKKPETGITKYIRDKIDKNLFKSIKTKITNLHEFEQHPKKIVNAFLNRLCRGHGSYYRSDYINSLPTDYLNAIKIAKIIYERNKINNKFSYVDDKVIKSIYPEFNFHYEKIKEIEKTYEKYLKKFGDK